MQNIYEETALMKLFSTYELKVEYIDSNNFKLLFEKEINIRDLNNNTTLMIMFMNNPNLLDHDVLTTMFY